MTGEVKIPVKGENGLIGGAVFREFPGLWVGKAKIYNALALWKK
jgi:hypothetical protein